MAEMGGGGVVELDDRQLCSMSDCYIGSVILLSFLKILLGPTCLILIPSTIIILFYCNIYINFKFYFLHQQFKKIKNKNKILKILKNMIEPRYQKLLLKIKKTKQDFGDTMVVNPTITEIH